MQIRIVFIVVLTLFFTTFFSTFGRASITTNDGFNPDINGTINTIAVQPDGNILIGGEFTEINSEPRSYIARLTHDGSLDSSFNPGAGFIVNTIVVQPDGRIIVGGMFNSLGGAARSNVGRLNADGTLDTTFNPVMTQEVRAIALQPDGKILVCGTFTVVRLNADGSVDESFSSSITVDGEGIRTVHIQPDGKILIGGSFAYINGEERLNIARLNENGSTDTSFESVFMSGGDTGVYTIACELDGKILIGGSFEAIDYLDISNLARLNNDGSVDPSFNLSPGSGAPSIVYALSIQPDGKILVGGNFTTLGWEDRNLIGRVNTDGTLDTAFYCSNSIYGGEVKTIAIQSDGKILVGGEYNSWGTPHFLTRLHADGNRELNFQPSANNDIYAMAIQSDGQLIASGAFDQLNGTSRKYIGHLKEDGSLNNTFSLGADGYVETLTIQNDGKILIGGQFHSLYGAPRAHIGRLNPDGSVDESFNPGVDGYVSVFALQTDGKIIVGGDFSIIGGIERYDIARLNTDGSVDTTFYSRIEGRVSSLAIQGDGKILVGGSFTSINSVDRWNIARLNTDGTLDADFNPSAEGVCVSDGDAVEAIELQADGKILVGGCFTSLDGLTKNYIGRLSIDGSIDTLFNPDADGPVHSIVVQADGKILAGGEFTVIGGGSYQYIARLNVNGSIDNTFYYNGDSFIPDSVIELILQPDNKILVGMYSMDMGNNIFRLNSDGSNDVFSNPAVIDGNVLSMALQADGKIVVGGEFLHLEDNPINRIGRLNDDGSLDTTFAAGTNNFVETVCVQPDGKMLVGGHFNTLLGTTRNHIGRINAEGSVDSTFDPGADDIVSALYVQPDGKILVGGHFAKLDEISRNHLGRLNADGSIDSDFNPNADGPVEAFAVQPDSKIVVGGSFTNLGGTLQNSITRLNEDGSIDTSFDASSDGSVYALAIQNDGKILAGGLFDSLNGLTKNSIGRLNADGTIDESFSPELNSTITPDYFVESISIQSDGKILLGGSFTSVDGITRNNICRLNADGSLDTTFDSSTDGAVYSLLLQPDGKILAGGSFTTLGGMARDNIGRFTNTIPALQNVSVPNAETIQWQRRGSSPEFDYTWFRYSTDLLNWSDLGNGSRITGGWQLSGLSLPTDQVFYIKAGGSFGSDSIIEVIRQTYIANNGTYSINASVSGNGSISPIGQSDVTQGNSQEYLLTPADGYHIADVVIDNFSVGAVSSYTFSNVMADHTIAAIFAIDTYTISTDVTGNGIISPTGEVVVNYASSQTFDILPAEGHHVTDVLVDGESVGAVTSYEFSNVTENHSIEAIFAINTYTINASVTGSGSISPSGDISVNHGNSQAFDITIPDGHHISDVLVDDESVGVVTSYQFSNVTDNHTIEAVIEINQYDVQATAGENGKLGSSTPVSQKVDHGSTVQLTFDADAGYHVASISGCGIDYTNSNQAVSSKTETTGAITAACTVNSTFSINHYQLSTSISGTGSGTVFSEPAGIYCGLDCSQTYEYNTPITLTAASETGTTFTGWSGDGCSGTESTCDVAMDQARNITASFARDFHELTIVKSGSGRGTVTSQEGGISCDSFCYDDSAQYANNASVTLSVTNVPPGSIFSGWSGGGCSGTGDCVVNMIDHTTVTATFDIDTGYSLNSKAVIVAGYGDDPTNWLWEETELNASYAYRILLEQGFKKENIRLLSPENIDADRNNIYDDRFGDATLENLQASVQSWAADADDLVIYMVGHGGPGKFIMKYVDGGAGDVTLYASSLKTWLDNLQAVMSGRVVILYDACYSGSFISKLGSSQEDRIVLTSSSNIEKSKFLSNGRLSFSYQFWSVVYEGGLVLDAFTHADTMMTSQHACYDTNNDGIANDLYNDIFPEFVIGAGIKNAAATLPFIEEVAEGQKLSKDTTTATLWVKVNYSGTLSEVKAVITPPGYNPSSADRDNELPEIKLVYSSENQRYEAKYDQFTQSGKYEIAYYAMNELMEFSIPKVSSVTVPGSFPWTFLIPILEAGQKN